MDELVPTAALAPVLCAYPDVAVNLHGRGPQSHRRLVETGPRRALWFANEEVPESAGAPTWRDGEHEAVRWCRLLHEYGIEAEPADLDLPAPPVAPPRSSVGATLVHPGAAYASRRWPADRWAEVVRHERERGRPVVVSGGPGEEVLAHEVAEAGGLGPDAVLTGLSLLELAAAVHAAARVASPDTGVAHLATALRAPSVILFGPTPPETWGPPADRREHRVLWAGSTGDPLGSEPDGGLLKITPEEVSAALA